MADRCATAAKSAACWTLPLDSMAKPVWRQFITSLWSPKMEKAWVPTVRDATCSTPGRRSPEMRCMVGIISIRPWDAVKLVARVPASSAPWQAPQAPASDCISTRRTVWPKMFFFPLADQSSACSAMGLEGVIG